MQGEGRTVKEIISCSKTFLFINVNENTVVTNPCDKWWLENLHECRQARISTNLRDYRIKYNTILESLLYSVELCQFVVFHMYQKLLFIAISLPGISNFKNKRI